MKKYLIITCLFAIGLIACNRPRIVVESDDTEGFDIVKVYVGDTICRITWEGKTAMIDPNGNPREGRFFHFHDYDSVITQFICCDKTYYGTIVDGHINDHIADDTFVLVDQKPVDSIFGKFIKIYIDNNPDNYFIRRKYDTCQNYYDKMTMLDLSRIHQYWIINKMTRDVYGPLSYDDYLNMKKQLGVPPDLMLKRESLQKDYF